MMTPEQNEGNAWKRRKVLLGIPAIAAVALGLAEIRDASATASKAVGEPCQHSDQCITGCCLYTKNRSGSFCRYMRSCKRHQRRIRG